MVDFFEVLFAAGHVSLDLSNIGISFVGIFGSGGSYGLGGILRYFFPKFSQSAS
jgi:hypothetical protein